MTADRRPGSFVGLAGVIAQAIVTGPRWISGSMPILITATVAFSTINA